MASPVDCLTHHRSCRSACPLATSGPIRFAAPAPLKSYDTHSNAMNSSAIDELKSRWLDQRVRIRTARADLRRFVGLDGVVKAVNWNGRCLVEFEHGQDIGWYDLAPADLVCVDPPADVEAEPDETNGDGGTR